MARLPLRDDCNFSLRKGPAWKILCADSQLYSEHEAELRLGPPRSVLRV